GVMSPPPPPISSIVKLFGSPDAASSFGPCCTAPSAETVKMLMPSVVILMLPTQNPEWLVFVPAGLPSSVCSTYAGGAVVQPLLPRRTLSTDLMRGRSQPLVSPAPTPMIATAGLIMLKYVGLLLLSLP